jgi:putative DNA primase/helicase
MARRARGRRKGSGGKGTPLNGAGPDPAGVDKRIAELARLDDLAYYKARKDAAKELGLSLKQLDKLVMVKRPPPTEQVRQGGAITFPTIEPWPQRVDGVALLDDLADALKRYIILTAEQAHAVALWIAFTHAFDAFEVSPRLVVKSVQKRSGKTRLLTVLDRLVAKPRPLSGITSAALLRVIEIHRPTLLIDETDALMKGDKDMAERLRGILNAGFNKRTATMILTVPLRDGGHNVRQFSCWAPLALAGLGRLHETIRDRSIEIKLKRKLKDEVVQTLRERDGGDLKEIERKLVRWTTDNLDDLREARPEMPDGLGDREVDAWEPLVAIADLAGGEWRAQAHKAAKALASGDTGKDNLLMADIRDAFDHFGANTVSGEDLTGYLVGLEDRSYAEWGKAQKPLSKHQLARLLKPYKVESKSIYASRYERLRGYRRQDFEDAFARYAPVKNTDPDPPQSLDAIPF